MADEPQVYADDEVQAKLGEAGLGGWSLEGGVIRRRYKTGGWPITLMLVNAVGFLCEAAFHHADLEVSYAEVSVALATHSAGGITDNDFELARRIEDLALWQPGPDSSLDGPSKTFVTEPDAG